MKKLIQISAKLVIILTLIVSSLFVYGCSKEEKQNNHEVILYKNSEEVIINSSDISDQATYLNYQVEDYIVQMFAVKASDGSIRTAFNTCGACNPDINSYFIQNGEYFECQTCGNKFHIDEIGLERSFGCAPISILEDEKDSIGKDLII